MAPSLLLAEDDISVQRVAIRMIERLGWGVSSTASGVEAVELTLTSSFDAVVLDLGLQDIDGLEVARQIRAQESGRRTPLIAITGDASPKAKARCLEAGMDDYIAKPMSLSALRMALTPWGNTHDRRKVPSGELRSVSKLDSFVPNVLLEGANGDRRVAREIAKMFLRDAEVRVVQLRNATLAGDDNERIRLAHKLKGAASMVGAMRLTILADELEGSSPAELPTKLTALGAELALVAQAMLAFTEPPEATHGA